MKVADDLKKVREVKELRVYNSALTFNLAMLGIVILSLLLPGIFSGASGIIIAVVAWQYEKSKIERLKYEYGFEPNEPIKLKRINPPSIWISGALWLLAIIVFIIVYFK